MLARSPFFALFCCLAGTLWIASFSACDAWTPVARPVQPERVLEGAARVEVPLPSGRYVLVRRFDDAGESNLAIVDWNTKSSCDLPASVRYLPALQPPTKERNRAPFFMLPLIVQDGDKQVLRFADERCHILDQFGVISANYRYFPLDEDGREVLLHGNGSGVVTLADPWRNTANVVAERVQTFRPVSRAGLSSPQLFWFVESGKLTQRALDGTVLLTLGSAVTAYVDREYDALRVAYVDGGDLYEAVGPDFTPVLIAKDACEPVYRGDSLDRFEPCAKRQLVRAGVYSGEIETFDDGVFSSYTEGGINFQIRTEPGGAVRMFARPPGKASMEIDPPFQVTPLVLDSQHAAGLIDCRRLQAKMHPNESAPPESPDDPRDEYDATDLIPCAPGESSFAIWTYGESTAMPVFHRVVELLSPIPDTRNGSYWWVTLHKIPNGQQRLSIFNQRAMALEPVADGIPRLNALGDGSGVRGYSVDRPAPYAVVPLLIYNQGAAPLASNDKASRGTLHVRLMSGQLDSKVGEDVTSFTLVTSPLLGVVFGVEESSSDGSNLGLWFAAL